MIPESFMKEKRNFDNFISDKAKTLPRYVSPEKLWCKIESDLKALQKKKDIKRDFKWLNNLIRFDIKPVWRYAALAVSVTIILFFVLPRLLYEPDPLAEIEKAEKAQTPKRTPKKSSTGPKMVFTPHSSSGTKKKKTPKTTPKKTTAKNTPKKTPKKTPKRKSQ